MCCDGDVDSDVLRVNHHQIRHTCSHSSGGLEYHGWRRKLLSVPLFFASAGAGCGADKRADIITQESAHE